MFLHTLREKLFLEIQLLRNAFSDRQVFISTHKETMSAYIMYKFLKSNLGGDRISFKERQLQQDIAVA